MEDAQFVCDSSSSSTIPVTATVAFHDQQHFRRRANGSGMVPAALFAQGATGRIPVHVGRAVLLPQLAPTLPVAAAVEAAAGAKAFQTIHHEALGRQGICRAESIQLGLSIPREQVRAASAAERIKSALLRNTVESWKSSGFKIINSRSTIISDSVDIGARANPYGIYPIVFPFHGHSFSRSDQPCQSTEMPLDTRVPHSQHHQVPQGYIASGMTLDYYWAEIMRRAGCFGLAESFIPTSTTTYRDRAHFSSNCRARKCGETRKPSVGAGKSKLDRQGSLRTAKAVSVEAASAIRFSTRAKAGGSVGTTFNGGLARRGRTKDERGQNVRFSTTGGGNVDSSSEHTAPLPSGIEVTAKLIPPAVQWRGRWAYGSCPGGSIPFPQGTGVSSMGIGSHEMREIGTMSHKMLERKAANPVPSTLEDNFDNCLIGVALQTQQQAGARLAVAPLNTLRSDDRRETDGDESVTFFPQDTLSLRDVKDRVKPEMMEAGDQREDNGPLHNVVDVPPLRSTVEPQIFQLSDVEVRSFDFQRRGDQESGSLGHEEHWLGGEAHELISSKKDSPTGRISQIATENADVSTTGLCSAEETLVSEVRARSVETHAGGSLGELQSSGTSNTSERSKMLNNAWLAHVSAPSGPPVIVQSVPPPLSVEYIRGIRQQSPLESLPSWAHQPPVLELDTEYSSSSLALPGARVIRGRDNPGRLDLGEVVWQGSIFSNKRKHRAKPACTHALMTLEPSLGMRSTSWTCMDGECVPPAVEDTGIAEVRAGAGGSRNPEQCLVHRWRRSGQPKTAICSFPGCQRRWAWESTLAEKAMGHSTQCCPQHKHDGIFQIREANEDLHDALHIREGTATKRRRSFRPGA